MSRIEQGLDKNGIEHFRLIQEDSLKWLASQKDASLRNIVTGFPDYNEVKSVMDWDKYQLWVKDIVNLCFQKVHQNGYCIFIQTDRKLGAKSNPKGVYELYSKAATLIDLAANNETKTRLLWHKIAAFTKPGEISIRPGYSHILCFSVFGRHDLDNAYTDIVLAPTKLYENATPLEAAEMVVQYIKKYYNPTDRVFENTLPFDIVDPFIGQGTVGLVALKYGLRVLGLDIEAEQIDSAKRNLFDKLSTTSLKPDHNIMVVNDPIFEQNRRILHVDSRQLSYLNNQHRQGLYPPPAIFLSEMVRNAKLEFPYKRYQHDEKSLLRSFWALKNLDFTQRLTILEDTPVNRQAMRCVKDLKDYIRLPVRYCDLGATESGPTRCYRVDTVNGRPELVVYRQSKTDYENFDWLSDYWTEDLRVSCKSDGNPSYLELWQNPQKLSELFNFMLKPYQRGGLGINELTSRTIQDAMFNDRSWRECTQFKPSLFYTLVKLFNVKTVLDTSAGWGDRLIGAMAANIVTYTGIDPEMALQRRYEMIYQTFQDFVCPSHSYFVFPYKSEDPQTFREIRKTISRDYDMIFSSPPFFTYEAYSNDFDKSYGKMNELTWLNEFMYPTLKNSWELLRNGGYYVLYLCNTSGKNPRTAFTSTELINLWIAQNLKGALMVGTLGVGKDGGDRYLTCWIWTKIGGHSLSP